MGPALATTGLLAFIAAWNEFLFALTFTLSTEMRTVPVAIALISGASAYELPWGNIMAASVIVTVPLIVLVLIFQRADRLRPDRRRGQGLIAAVLLNLPWRVLLMALKSFVRHLISFYGSQSPVIWSSV